MFTQKCKKCYEQVQWWNIISFVYSIAYSMSWIIMAQWSHLASSMCINIDSGSGGLPVWRQATGGTNDSFLTIRHQLGNSVKFEANAFKHVVCKMSTIVFIPQCLINHLFTIKQILHVLYHCGSLRPFAIMNLYRHCPRWWWVAGLAPDH